MDPDAKKFDDANIYGKNGLKYSVMLYFVDVSSNKNSYFKLQLIESSGRYTYDQSSKLVLNKLNSSFIDRTLLLPIVTTFFYR